MFWEVMCTCCPVDKLFESIRGKSNPAQPSMDTEVLKLLREINGNLEKIVKRQPHEAEDHMLKRDKREAKEARFVADQLNSGQTGLF